MRLLILGHSSTVGTGLVDRSRAWPWLVEKELPVLIGEPVEMTHVVIAPIGPRAVPRAVAAVEEHQPDLIVFSYGAFPYIAATVGYRVRRRFGERAYRLYRRVAEPFEQKTANPNGGAPRTNRWGRWLARRIIGTDTLTTKAEVLGIHTEILHKLSQREGTPVIIYGEPDMTRAVLRNNKKANALLSEHRRLITEIGRSRRFIVADCTTAFDSVPDRDALFHSDGVHKSALGHRLQADALYDALRLPPSPYAEAMAGASY